MTGITSNKALSQRIVGPLLTPIILNSVIISPGTKIQPVCEPVVFALYLLPTLSPGLSFKFLTSTELQLIFILFTFVL